MITDLQRTTNEISDLSPLEDTRYENIFKVAQSDKYFFYNITKKVTFPEDLSTDIFFQMAPTARMPWTTLAHQVYGDQNLWWLICCVNKIQNPINNPTPGRTYKFIKPTYVSRILVEINKLLK